MTMPAMSCPITVEMLAAVTPMIGIYAMNTIDLFKALSNETRLNILQWLKEPHKHFDKPSAHLSKNMSEKGGDTNRFFSICQCR